MSIDPETWALIDTLTVGEPIAVRPLSPDFVDPAAPAEFPDLDRDLIEELTGGEQNLRVTRCRVQIGMIHKIGADGIEHDERCCDGLAPLVHALREGRHEDLKRHLATLDIDGPIAFRSLRHDFFSFGLAGGR